jgi:hypothetical protein
MLSTLSPAAQIAFAVLASCAYGGVVAYLGNLGLKKGEALLSDPNFKVKNNGPSTAVIFALSWLFISICGPAMPYAAIALIPFVTYILGVRFGCAPVMA